MELSLRDSRISCLLPLVIYLELIPLVSVASNWIPFSSNFLLSEPSFFKNSFVSVTSSRFSKDKELFCSFKVKSVIPDSLRASSVPCTSETFKRNSSPFLVGSVSST